jgi:hypothetical protein
VYTAGYLIHRVDIWCMSVSKDVVVLNQFHPFGALSWL